MAPLSHSLLPSNGPFCARLGRTDRCSIIRAQPIDTAEPLRQSRNILQAQRLEESNTATPPQAYTETCRSPCHVVEDRADSAGVLAEVSERLLRNSLAGSLSGLLENVNSMGSWLVDSETLQHSMMSVQVNSRPAQPGQQQASRPPGKDPKQREDFYANIGEAIRTLKSEIPRLFQEDLTYDIYRDDIIFRDPRNFFQGKKDYQTIFWSLRFHGQLFFRLLYVDVLRIWESPENVKDSGTVLKMRWTVHGIPRVPWDAEGIFDGISTFKVDSNGKIFEHAVNNVVLRDPPKLGNPFLAGLSLARLAGQQQQQPCPGAWFKTEAAVGSEGKEGN